MNAPAPTAKRRYCRSRETVGRIEAITKLRNAGWTFQDIGRKVGVSPQAASVAFYRAARSAPPAVAWRLADELRASWSLGYFRGPEREARARLAAAYGVSPEVVEAALDGPRDGASPDPERTSLLDRLRAARPEQHREIFDGQVAK